MNRKCVAYMRFSSENQRETSIEYQRTAIEKYCADNNFTIVHEYIDRAQSATTDHRVEFQNMINAANWNPEWNAIIVYDLSRFSRNMTDAAKYSDTLQRYGIEIISVTEHSDDSPEGKFARNIKFCVNQYYSDNNSRRTHDAQNNRASKAQHNGGRAPLGYNVDEEGRLVINEEEAVIVRKVFDMYLAGHSYNTMAKNLNDAGYTTKEGNSFNKNSFSSILRQEKYAGVFVWNRASPKVRNHEGKKTRNNHRSKPAEEIIRIPDGCPAIISQETFQKAQRRLTARAYGKSTTKARRLYVLGGLGILKCGCCGRHMVGMPRTCRGRSYVTYACPGHKGKDAVCPTKEIPAEYVNKLVLGYVVPTYLREEFIPAINKALTSDFDDDALTWRKRGIERKINNVARSLEARFSETMAERLEQLEKEKVELLEQMERRETTTITIGKENLKEAQKKLYRYLMTSSDVEARDFLKSVIKEVKITNDTVSFTLNVD